jgi:hypothetical protein
MIKIKLVKDDSLVVSFIEWVQLHPPVSDNLLKIENSILQLKGNNSLFHERFLQLKGNNSNFEGRFNKYICLCLTLIYHTLFKKNQGENEVNLLNKLKTWLRYSFLVTFSELYLEVLFGINDDYS